VADAHELLLAYLAQQHTGDTTHFRDYLYFYSGREAVEHLAQVVTGLDSLVLGEPQILGQVTGAYMQAVEAHTTGPVLNALFQAMIRTGKRARAETQISSRPASVSSVAIALAQKVVGNLNGHSILIAGLGEMGQLALNAVRKRGATRIALANRSRERAEALAAEWGGHVYGLEELPQALAEADVVICATGAPQAIISAAAVRQAMAARQKRALVLIDIAVPRDVDPAVEQVKNVHLFNMDDLQEGLDEALAARQREVPRVEAIIAEEMADLDMEFRKLAVRPLITDLRQRAEAIRRQELERTLRHLGDDLDPETLKHVQHLSRSLVNKILHEPTVRLREKATNGQASKYADTVRDLFDLNNSLEG
jgi:glutamyl-tRNA reductase